MSDHIDATHAQAVELRSGYTYTVSLPGDRQCVFDLSRPREIWVRPPPPPVPSRWTSRNDWMLVLDPVVVLRRGRSTSVRVFEEAGSTWTYTSGPPRRITYASREELPVFIEWD